MMSAVLEYGHQALRQRAVIVERIDAALTDLIADLLETMQAYRGVGLAASQIGRTEALFVLNVPPEEAQGLAMPMVLINPEILEMEGEQEAQEGCLSFPEIYANIKRAMTVTVRFTTPDGSQRECVVHGLVARAVQHETDHLNGVLLVDRMSAVQKVAHAGRLKRLKKGRQGDRIAR